MMWINSLRMENLKVSCCSIQSKALELARESGDQDFSASRGWLEKFFKRHHLSLHRRTTVSQRLPQDLVPKVIGFIMATRRLCHINSYTPLWLDMPGRDHCCPHRRKVDSNSYHRSRQGKVHCLSRRNGRWKKAEPFVVFKGVRPIAELMKIPGVVVAFSKNGWMNEELTKDWVKRAWRSLSFNRRLLVWDAYRRHIMATVRSVVKQTNTDMNIIPGGLTSQLQPADLCWNKPFKEAYKAKYNEWMATGRQVLHSCRQCSCSQQRTLLAVVSRGLGIYFHRHHHSLVIGVWNFCLRRWHRRCQYSLSKVWWGSERSVAYDHRKYCHPSF